MMGRYVVNKETFLDDVKDHKLKILMDNGVYRHIQLKADFTGCQHFNIVTTPSYLHYYGDMGSFTFSRVQDMFKFFRRKDLKINTGYTGYWAEKLESVDKCDGYKTFEWDLFEENVLSYIDDDEDENNDIRQSWMKEQLKYAEQDEWGAIEFVRNFDEYNEHGITLQDLFECNQGYEESTRYLWCCYAIVWAIKQYDHVTMEAKEYDRIYEDAAKAEE